MSKLHLVGFHEKDTHLGNSLGLLPVGGGVLQHFAHARSGAGDDPSQGGPSPIIRQRKGVARAGSRNHAAASGFLDNLDSIPFGIMKLKVACSLTILLDGPNIDSAPG